MKDSFKYYEKQVTEHWGATDAYKEYKEKSSGRSEAQSRDINEGLMNIFSKFAALDCAPADESAQELVAKLQSYITDNFYTCTDEILTGLGKMYVADSEFKNNIDRYAGDGTAEFVSKAIEIYTKQ
ncbi:MAG: TipAS antibiotic-recognition domain-containing protein [Eubacterium sp.]|nr:TipAS antibiotic-recognition domain-containing protein [Eubacterium sp.]